ncbi:antA/AntB antirepressor family protein [Psychrobacter coccoides]|nr:antA/AntB antirepressor family protein [Psychrobacter coccoides]
MNFPTVQQHDGLQQAVSARELHDFLSGGERFSKWFERMVSYGFQVNIDYVGCTRWYAPANQELQDYFLSVDMAKEISMIQRSNKGRQARQYFIECERQAKASSPVTPAIPQSYAEALQLAADQARQLELAAPKVAHYDNVVERAGLLNATQVAQKVRLSAVAMNKILDELGVYNRAVKRSRVFQQWFIDNGLGMVKQTEQGYSQALFTKRGEAWVVERLISEGVA